MWCDAMYAMRCGVWRGWPSRFLCTVRSLSLPCPSPPLALAVSSFFIRSTGDASDATRSSNAATAIFRKSLRPSNSARRSFCSSACTPNCDTSHDATVIVSKGYCLSLRVLAGSAGLACCTAVSGSWPRQTGLGRVRIGRVLRTTHSLQQTGPVCACASRTLHVPISRSSAAKKESPRDGLHLATSHSMSSGCVWSR